MSFQILFFIRFFFVRFTSLAKIFWKKSEEKIHESHERRLCLSCDVMSSIRFLSFLRFYVPNQSFRIYLENYHNCCGRSWQASSSSSRPIQFIENYCACVCVRLHRIMYVSVPMSVYPSVSVCL